MPPLAWGMDPLLHTSGGNMQSSGRSVLVWSETSYFTSKPSSPFWSMSRPVMSGKDREATCRRIRWLTMITAHLTTFRASLPLCLPARLTDISLTASAPAAPPSWLPHSRGPPPVDPHQAHNKHLLPGNTGPGSPSPQTSGLLGYKHPRGSAYWDPSVKSPHSSTAPCLCGVLPALRQPPALLSWPLPLSPPPDTPIWELGACQGLPRHLSPPLLPSGA